VQKGNRALVKLADPLMSPPQKWGEEDNWTTMVCYLLALLQRERIKVRDYLRRPEEYFAAKRKSLRQDQPPERLEKVSVSLANFSAEEFAVALDAHFPAAEQISHRGHCLFGVFGARTDREDQIAK
jgi:hypothetical protein